MYLMITKQNHAHRPWGRRWSFAVSYFSVGPWTPFLQHAAISAVMAALGPLDSVADVDMGEVTRVRFVSRPSAMSTALSTERGIHPRATVASQDLTVAPLEQTAAHAKEALPRVLDICTWGYAAAPSFMCVDVSSCLAKRSINVLETDTRHRTPTHPLRRRWPAASAPTVTQFARNASVITSASSLVSVRTRTMP